MVSLSKYLQIMQTSLTTPALYLQVRTEHGMH